MDSGGLVFVSEACKVARAASPSLHRKCTHIIIVLRMLQIAVPQLQRRQWERADLPFSHAEPGILGSGWKSPGRLNAANHHSAHQAPVSLAARMRYSCNG